MTLMWLVSLILFLLAGTVMAWPLFHPAAKPFLDHPEGWDGFNEQDALLEAMSELDLDRATGKISEEAYQARKRAYHFAYQRFTGKPTGGR
ncbi:MAG: hypothetical protein OEV94_05705 [Deltaproteobacteria bacterium]|nr:hypothetical protein [Deltaproteobacteria bacterium]